MKEAWEPSWSAHAKTKYGNRVDEATESAVIENATNFPTYDQTPTSNELCKKWVFASHAGILSIWLRDKMETIKKRQNAQETKVTNDNGIILTKAWDQVLKRRNMIIKLW